MGPDLEAIASDVLQGLQYSFVSAAAHPEIRLPFGSLEEAFQDAIGLRHPEQRWIYHSRARRLVLAPAATRQTAFGRYGLFGAEEFACGGLDIAYRHLAAERPSGRRLSLARRPPAPEPEVPAARPSRRTLALCLTDVACMDRPAGGSGDEIAIAGLALDPAGGAVKLDRFTARADLEPGMRKAYGAHGRRFCEFRLPELTSDQPVTYGAAVFLDVADRAGFSEALAGAWVKASPILQHAVESRFGGDSAGVVARVAGAVLERFVRWLGTEFQDDVLPPSVAYAGMHGGVPSGAGTPGWLAFGGPRGRFHIGGHWRIVTA